MIIMIAKIYECHCVPDLVLSISHVSSHSILTATRRLRPDPCSSDEEPKGDNVENPIQGTTVQKGQSWAVWQRR